MSNISLLGVPVPPRRIITDTEVKLADFLDGRTWLTDEVVVAVVLVVVVVAAVAVAVAAVVAVVVVAAVVAAAAAAAAAASAAPAVSCCDGSDDVRGCGCD